MTDHEDNNRKLPQNTPVVDNMHHYAMFGYKRFKSSGDMEQTYVFCMALQVMMIKKTFRRYGRIAANSFTSSTTKGKNLHEHFKSAINQQLQMIKQRQKSKT